MISAPILALWLLAATPPPVVDGAKVFDDASRLRLEADVLHFIRKSGAEAQVATFAKTPKEGPITATTQEAAKRGFGSRWIFVAYWADSQTIRVESQGVPIERKDLADVLTEDAHLRLAKQDVVGAIRVVTMESFRLARRWTPILAFRRWAWSWGGWFGEFFLVAGGALLVLVIGVFMLAGAGNEYDMAVRRTDNASRDIARKGKTLFIAGKLLEKAMPRKKP